MSTTGTQRQPTDQEWAAIRYVRALSDDEVVTLSSRLRRGDRKLAAANQAERALLGAMCDIDPDIATRRRGLLAWRLRTTKPVPKAPTKPAPTLVCRLAYTTSASDFAPAAPVVPARGGKTARHGVNGYGVVRPPMSAEAMAMSERALARQEGLATGPANAQGPRPVRGATVPDSAGQVRARARKK